MDVAQTAQAPVAQVAQEVAQAVPAAAEAASNAAPAVAEQGGGFFSNLKDSLSPSNIMEKIRENKQLLLDIAIYGAIGFFVGFFIRRFSTFVIILAGLIISLILLHNFNVINFAINWDWIQAHTGFKAVAMGQGDIMSFLKDNFVIIASSIVGFLIGLKLS